MQSDDDGDLFSFSNSQTTGLASRKEITMEPTDPNAASEYESQPRRFLIISPTRSESFVHRFMPLVDRLAIPHAIFSTYVNPCPDAPRTLRTSNDLWHTAEQVLMFLRDSPSAVVPQYDGYLVASFSDHPLVRQLQGLVYPRPVISLIDACMLVGSQLSDNNNSTWGIITTSVTYENQPAIIYENKFVPRNHQLWHHLGGSMLPFVERAPNAVCLANVSQDDISPRRVKSEQEMMHKLAFAWNEVVNTTIRLIRACGGNISAICLGDTALHGSEPWVHAACKMELGPVKGSQVRIFNAFSAGIICLGAVSWNPWPRFPVEVDRSECWHAVKQYRTEAGGDAAATAGRGPVQSASAPPTIH
ncbi:hypothetical protein B0H63DRAFT_550557 [Podospora didyma]|uniref:Uncharacterized protein n=1 Tax=Podospora didyma TaxID=330526 RepID=A0AAE0N6N7_9PEZI|nr:hypothetical protein B0H63DRAFT_550557 [Podospora didyma]